MRKKIGVPSTVHNSVRTELRWQRELLNLLSEYSLKGMEMNNLLYSIPTFNAILTQYGCFVCACT